mmetsp:Transcript_452/g.1692  ORF Transcript_452/g.1692 Transcript_452/m.1692 type:complete len:317 (+) Transcript_452:391-1341(+)
MSRLLNFFAKKSTSQMRSFFDVPSSAPSSTLMTRNGSRRNLLFGSVCDCTVTTGRPSVPRGTATLAGAGFGSSAFFSAAAGAAGAAAAAGFASSSAPASSSSRSRSSPLRSSDSSSSAPRSPAVRPASAPPCCVTAPVTLPSPSSSSRSRSSPDRSSDSSSSSAAGAATAPSSSPRSRSSSSSTSSSSSKSRSASSRSSSSSPPSAAPAASAAFFFFCTWTGLPSSPIFSYALAMARTVTLPPSPTILRTGEPMSLARRPSSSSPSTPPAPRPRRDFWSSAIAFSSVATSCRSFSASARSSASSPPRVACCCMSCS